MTSLGRRLFGFGLMAGVGLAMAAAPQAAMAQWQPQKPVEFVIMAGQGGGEEAGGGRGGEGHKRRGRGDASLLLGSNTL